MKRLLFIYIFLISSLSLFAEGEFRKITSLKERQKLLNTGVMYTDPRGFFYKSDVDFTLLPNLFSLSQPMQKVPVADEKDQKRPLTSLFEILKLISQEIKPTGIVIRGKVKALFFGNKYLREGGSLTVNYYGKPYTVVVQSIDKDGFVLKLEDFTIKHEFETYEAQPSAPSISSPNNSETPPKKG